MGVQTSKDLEERISLDQCFLGSWTKILQENEQYARDIAENLMKYIGVVGKIKVGYWGFRGGKYTESIKEGFLTIEPAGPRDIIAYIDMIAEDRDIRVIAITKECLQIDYKGQRVIISFDHSNLSSSNEDLY